MTKRVLVTGATGFIGRHTLQPLLERGYEVHAVYHAHAIESDPQIAWHRADLLDAKDIERVAAAVQATHLLHFAWIAAPGIYWTSPENLLWKERTLLLLREFAKSGGTRAVIAGTCAEYDWTISQDVLTESTSPLQPATPYGISKHEGRLATESYAEGSGLSLAWGRIFFLYGPHEAKTRLVPYIITSLLKDEVAECTPGEQIRDFLHVQDAAHAFVSLLESNAEGAVNIGSGKPVAIKDIIDAIARQLGKEDLVRLGAKPIPQGEPARLVADITRLSKEVGWSPILNLHEGLKETIAWWKHQGSS
ncbi:NAD(P)-dependent oxidoreductase [Candidatus Kaiserbacteria bacterium]|nr:NAD(P)-dependent oxidoreductase [Candidatus Kaiserbacteria bacterium]